MRSLFLYSLGLLHGSLMRMIESEDDLNFFAEEHGLSRDDFKNLKIQVETIVKNFYTQ